MPRLRLHSSGALVPLDHPRHDLRSTSAWQSVRAQVLREEATCAECGSTEYPSVDHIVSLARGGAFLDRSNLRRLCGPCNSSRGAA